MSHFGSAGPPDIRDTHSLLVLNITFRTSADDLYPLFDRYGKVVDIFIPRDRRTGESRGFAFVRYKYAEEAQKAIERLDGRNVDGRDMVVQYAKYGRDMETIHRGKITQASPSKWSSRSRSRSPARRERERPRSPVRGKRNFGGPPSRGSRPYPSPPRGRDRHDAAPPPSGRHRDEYRERDHRHRSRSRDRYERSDRYRERERDHRRRSPSRSASRSRSRSRGRAEFASKVVEREVSPPVRRDNSASPKQSSLSPGAERLSPARKSLSPVERESLSPVRSVSPAPRSVSPAQRSASRSPSPRRPTASLSLTPEPRSPFQD